MTTMLIDSQLSSETHNEMVALLTLVLLSRWVRFFCYGKTWQKKQMGIIVRYILFSKHTCVKFEFLTRFHIFPNAGLKCLAYI